MKRIMVMGVSPGVGKSTFARELGKILEIDVCHLDTLYWKPNWVEASLEEFTARQQEVVVQDQWIIEGNYNSTYVIREQHADTIIYLELPLFVCLYRVFKRWICHIGKTRPDMGKDCKEKLDYQFLKFICSTYYSRKKMMKDRFQVLIENDSHINIVLLKNKADIRSYIQTLDKRKVISS
jgi:adenylate kinase family enzyme